MRHWLGRSPKIDAASYESWRASLTILPARILVWTRTSDDGLLVLSPALLSVLHPSVGDVAGSSGGDWRHFGWHQIERGGWNNETGQLRWQTYSGKRGAVAMAEAARIPEVFKERVSASIMLEKFLPVAAETGRGVIIHARRSLADPRMPDEETYGGPISWHATLTRGVTWRTPGVRELADTAIAELRLEYAYS